jgi:multimeric flavodoxin WrbA
MSMAWHGWKYSVRDGKSPHKGGDSVNSYKVKVVDGEKLYVSYLPCDIGHRVTQPHQAYSKLAQSVDKYLRDAAKDVGSLRSNDRINDKRIEGETLKRRGTRTSARTTRVLGISTTNANDNIAPRKSTSEEALSFALNHAKNNLHTAETVMIKLRDLEFKHCEGYYSKNAKACIFPCSISEMDKEDQMLQIYEKVILWADVVLISTPIRWGDASSLYYKMIQRLNCVQNQSITNNRYLIQDKVAGFIITGGQDNVQHVAGDMLSFWSQLGFVFGKFPFVGWTRGWYSEDTENNYNMMMSSLTDDSKIGNNDIPPRRDIIMMLQGAIEMSHLVKNNGYHQHVLNLGE